ncbi:hypothetical protein ZEAMMB73_Zm00001d022190 [Zea mays]|jgi:hypothetical protein|uniref:Uncharacterized protein n=1 Tax=Zea mays TaxID=4577 RepID=A0A1D6IK84_MAIZE|nr:hypothetical protein ZEAMMB73_Zm00001d022190 [Zea mays]ONM59822.1 hypothetical protein ZEAMMB73_Zm00001d022190 [Zea mays]ONM59824.1 hypothetical protein ZEAMMB73_Zm00001d022190 [Zea mays]ONM59826.1 hypothetical protein ZEAMMB73_Zm00001d022190 [Zea mays]ONM59827.1 hypothetical protein ZEAMMB73_Zm00001d022190 [Zea mays]
MNQTNPVTKKLQCCLLLVVVLATGKQLQVRRGRRGQRGEDREEDPHQEVHRPRGQYLQGRRRGTRDGGEAPPEHGEAEGDDRQRHLRGRGGPLPGLPGRNPQAARRGEQHRAGLTAGTNNQMDIAAPPLHHSFLPHRRRRRHLRSDLLLGSFFFRSLED